MHERTCGRASVRACASVRVCLCLMKVEKEIFVFTTTTVSFLPLVPPSQWFRLHLRAQERAFANLFASLPRLLRFWTCSHPCLTRRKSKTVFVSGSDTSPGARRHPGGSKTQEPDFSTRTEALRGAAERFVPPFGTFGSSASTRANSIRRPRV